jgi:chromate reductase
LEIATATSNVLSICGSLRKGSFNAMVQRTLPSLAPPRMTIKPAPSFADFPLYSADIQNTAASPHRSTRLPALARRCAKLQSADRQKFLAGRVGKR